MSVCVCFFVCLLMDWISGGVDKFWLWLVWCDLINVGWKSYG